MSNEDLKSLVFLLIWAFVANTIAYNKGFYRLPERVGTHVKLRFGDVFVIFVLFLCIQLMLVPGGLLVYSYFLTGEWQLALENEHGWINIIAIIASALGVVLFCRVLRPQTAYILSLQGMTKFKDDISLGSVSWLICFPVVSLFAQLFSVILQYFGVSHDVDQVAVHYLKQILSDRSLFWTSFWLIIFLVPFIEEVLFRGFLQNWLRQKMGAKPAITIASAVFAAFHLSSSQGWHNIDLFAALFLLSCFMGLLYEKRASIWASAGLHMTFNAISEVVIVAQEGGFAQ